MGLLAPKTSLIETIQYQPKMKNLFFLLTFLSVTTFSFGQGSEKMLNFNGSSSYVNCGSVNLNGTALTMMGWVKVTQFNLNTASPAAQITSLWGAEAGNPTLIRLGDGLPLDKDKAQFVVSTNGTPSKLNGTRVLNAGEWYHIAGVYDGATMKLYINGILDATKTQTGAISNTAPFSLGQNYNPGRTLNGKLDEVSIWKAALSQATIRDWMCKEITPSHPNYANLEAYYPLNEGTGATTVDASPNNYNGTLISSPQWQNSEVPIGSALAHDYSAPFNVTLTQADQDTFWVNGVTGTPDAVYVYRVNGLPAVPASFPTGVAQADTSRHYGVFFLGGNNPTGNIKYKVTENSKYQNTNTCIFNWYERTSNADLTWSNSNAILGGPYYQKQTVSSSEYIIGFGGSASIYATPSSSICQGDSIVLSHGSSGLTYTWLLNGSPISNKTTNRLGAKSNGVYQLAYALGTSCADTTNTFTLNVNPLPNIGLAPFTSICESANTYNLSGGTPSGGSYGSPYVAGTLFVVNVSGDGKFPITYSITDVNGCKADTVQYLTVKPVPSVNLPSFGNKCINDAPINLNSGTPAGGDYYLKGNLATQADPALLGTGLHKLKYVVLDTNGCSGADSTAIIIYALPNVTLNIPDTTLCESFGAITLKGESPIGGSFSGNGVSGKSFNPNVGAGFHNIQYVFTEPVTGCSNNAIDSIEVFPTPVKPTVTNTNDTLFSPTSYKYYWYDMDDILQPSTKQFFVPDSTNYYYVIVENNYGCLSDPSGLVLWEKPIVIPPGSVNEVFQKTAFTIVPNPNNGSFSILNEDLQNNNFQIFNLEGKLVESVLGNKSVNLTLKRGVYLLKSENGLKTQKLIVL